MAGYSDRITRAMALQYGADLAYTEMISAEGLVRGNKRTFEMMNRAEGESILALQLYGSHPETLARAAEIAVEAGADLVDLNAGCPVPKVIRGGSGAALGRDAKALYRALKAMVDSVGREIPVTVKIRSGWDNENLNWKEAVTAAEDAGAAAVGFHPRTRAMRYGGRADRSLIAEMAASTKLPVIGSGDITDADSAAATLCQTGCAAVMIARGAVGNPWIFSSAGQFLGKRIPSESPTPEERIAAASFHFNAAAAAFGEETAVREIKKHLSGYITGWTGASDLRKKLMISTSPEELRRLLSYEGTEL